MRIHFFEEYPTATTPPQARVWPTRSTVFIACSSITEFRELSARLKAVNPNLMPGYWPVLRRSYWISPFSYTVELERLYCELETYRSEPTLPVLLDLELPIMRPLLFLLNAPWYFRNRYLIKQIAKLANVRCVSAEYWYAVGFLSFIPWLMGVSYPKVMHGRRIIMFYSSMNTSVFAESFWKYFTKSLSRALVRDPAIGIGVGTLATGVHGNEPVLKPDALKHDLEALQQIGTKEVTVFRLGGMTPAHASVLREFAESPEPPLP